MTLLEVENLKVSYSNHTAIENINFVVKEGEYICLVGENGSGKSTLIKTIVGLVKPEEGKINLNISLDEISYLRFKFPCNFKRDNNVRSSKT